jgi:citrate lyase subunit beta/citryl-CoA lyase
MEKAQTFRRRTILLTPATEEKKLEKACLLEVDAVILDLEDSIPPPRKLDARRSAVHLLKTLDFGYRERMVRINGVQTEYWLEDLASVLPLNLSAVMIPKVESAADVMTLEKEMDELEEKNGLSRITPVILTIETALGITCVEDIVRVSRRAQGVFLGSGDYSVSTGIRITRESLLYPRSRMAAAAATKNIQAIDAAYFADVKDVAAVREDALAARDLGFTGKVIFHPNQVAPVNEVFTPTAEEIEKAKLILDAYEQAYQKGVGVFLVGKDFVAIDVVLMARRTLARAGIPRNVKHAGKDH